jgi:uncharacterized protein
MIIAITGASGFIGRNTKIFFARKGMKIINVPRDIVYNKAAIEKKLQGVDVIIHLSGFPIHKRWTRKNRQKIYESRAISTQNIVEAVNKMNKPPSLIISTSAIGIYDNIHYHDENSEDFSTKFLGEICLAWEAPLYQINEENTRMIITRLGVVLGHGGVIKQLLPLYKMGFGGKIGHGQYPMPFIHINDLMRFYDEAIKNESYKGIYNLVAPDIITNAEFSSAFAQAVNKRARFTIPALALKIVFGQGIMSVINSPFVIPKRLLESGFKFEYDQIDFVLKHIIEDNRKQSK